MLLNVLQEPAIVTSVGGIVTAIGAAMNNTVKTILRGVLTKLTPKEEETKEEPNKEEPKKEEGHVMPPTYNAAAYRIHEIVLRLNTKLHCSRVSVLQFHNGSNFSTSAPMYKMTCTYESCANGIESVTGKMKDLMVSNYINLVGPLVWNRPVVNIQGVEEIDNCKLDSNPSSCSLTTSAFKIYSLDQDELPYGPLRNMMFSIGASVIYAASLRSVSGVPVGLILFQYVLKADSRSIIVDNTCDICAAVHTISGILGSGAA